MKIHLQVYNGKQSATYSINYTHHKKINLGRTTNNTHCLDKLEHLHLKLVDKKVVL